MVQVGPKCSPKVQPVLDVAIAKSGAGGGKWDERLPVKFEWFAAA